MTSPQEAGFTLRRLFPLTLSRCFQLKTVLERRHHLLINQSECRRRQDLMNTSQFPGFSLSRHLQHKTSFLWTRRFSPGEGVGFTTTPRVHFGQKSNIQSQSLEICPVTGHQTLVMSQSGSAGETVAQYFCCFSEVITTKWLPPMPCLMVHPPQ